MTRAEQLTTALRARGLATNRRLPKGSVQVLADELGIAPSYLKHIQRAVRVCSEREFSPPRALPGEEVCQAWPESGPCRRAATVRRGSMALCSECFAGLAAYVESAL